MNETEQQIYDFLKREEFRYSELARKSLSPRDFDDYNLKEICMYSTALKIKHGEHRK